MYYDPDIDIIGNEIDLNSYILDDLKSLKSKVIEQRKEEVKTSSTISNMDHLILI